MEHHKNYNIAILGLGYVGLPLALAFGEKYPTIGFDINSNRVNDLQKGIDTTMQSSAEEIACASHLQFTDRIENSKDCTIYIITVPTPVDAQQNPDLTSLLSATQLVASVLKKGDIVIYESTVYPGCTEEDCIPVLEAGSRFIFNQDFFVGYSPERINPGDKINTLKKIKKITSGSTPETAKIIDALYGSIIEAGTYLAPSIKVAEAAKSIENAQRDINISFVNELALIFDKMGIDTQEVLEAASTKWNFLPFKPGLVGGHCIGVDPYYLAYKASKLGHTPQVILSGRNVNDQMGLFVADKLIRLLLQKQIPIAGANILVLGVSFKENCPDIRNSKVFDIINHLQSHGMHVDAFDPYANAEEVLKTHHLKLVSALKVYDGILLAVAHDFFKALDYNSLKASDQSVLFDTKALLDKNIVDARL